MPTPDQRGYVPPKEKGEKNVASLQARYQALLDKHKIDPDERIDYTDPLFLVNSSQTGSSEWLKLKLISLSDVIREADLGDEEYERAEGFLDEWERYEPK
jgi:hypothetical protein